MQATLLHTIKYTIRFAIYLIWSLDAVLRTVLKTSPYSVFVVSRAKAIKWHSLAGNPMNFHFSFMRIIASCSFTLCSFESFCRSYFTERVQECTKSQALGIQTIFVATFDSSLSKQTDLCNKLKTNYDFYWHSLAIVETTRNNFATFYLTYHFPICTS